MTENGNIFCASDEEIIYAFCFREAGQFRFQNENDRSNYALRLKTELMSHKEENPEFNYASIQSITNMGLLEAELVLSTQHLGSSRGDLLFLLPPSPKGSIGIYKSKEEKWSEIGIYKSKEEKWSE